ncbi:MAG: VWA domain-containing protein [bacterium]|nr:VWA domain-containing protein [bacterium]
MRYSHTREKGTEIARLFKKNRTLVTGLISVLFVILFVSTILISGKSTSLSSSDQSFAVTPAVSVTCSLIHATGLNPGGQYVVKLLINGDAKIVAPSFLQPNTSGVLDVKIPQAQFPHLNGDTYGVYIIEFGSVQPTTADGKFTDCAPISSGTGQITVSCDLIHATGLNPGGQYVVKLLINGDAKIVAPSFLQPNASGVLDVKIPPSLFPHINGDKYSVYIIEFGSVQPSTQEGTFSGCSDTVAAVTFLGAVSLSNPRCNLPGVGGTILLTLQSNRRDDLGDYRIRGDKKGGESFYDRDIFRYNADNSVVSRGAVFVSPMTSGEYKFQLEKRVNGNFVGVANAVYPSSGYQALTCSTTPTSSTLGDVKAICTAPGVIEVSWRAHTGTTQYALEVFSEGIGGAGGGSRVFGQIGTTATKYTARDPDFLAGKKFTADVYAQSPNGVNVAGPAFSNTVTCPGTSVPSPVACTNKDIMLVMDTSGSMSAERKDANAAAKALLGRLPTNGSVQAGLVTFGSSSRLVSGLTSDMPSIISKVNLGASGGTNIAAGVNKADAQFGTSKTNIVVLMTDGIPNKNLAGRTVTLQEGQNAASTEIVNSFNTKKTIFYMVGLDTRDADVNSKWLNEVALGTGGKRYITSSSANLDEIFANMTRDLCTERPAGANPGLLNKLNSIVAQ